MIFSPSRVDTVRIDKRPFYIKRDDLIHTMYSGNKIRKLYALFGDDAIRHIVSYGGYQSNAMLSMAYFAKEKGIPFSYITKPVPEHVHDMDVGNYFHAIRLGMKNVQVVHTQYLETIQTLSAAYPDAVIVDQGAANPFAEAGIKMLAEEINAFVRESGISDLAVLLPSGTGATSLYLAKHTVSGVTVYTTPCVGDAEYLKQQWQRLEPDTRHYPTILSTRNKHHFAKPYKELWEMFETIGASGIEFDMVYAPKTWLSYFENRELFEGRAVMYVHTGGVIGNATQRLRYEHKKMI